MTEKEHIGDVWAFNTLNRAVKTGQNVYERALSRKIQWPSPKKYEQSPVQDDMVYTSIDDAFGTVMQFMSQTTRQCNRYYGTNPGSINKECDKQHCNRFHTPKYTAVQHKNPLQRSEDVHIVVQPGNYAVTAGDWGTQQQQTHVVRLDQGQTVDLDFCV